MNETHNLCITIMTCIQIHVECGGNKQSKLEKILNIEAITCRNIKSIDKI